jgi:hypothetical protein
VRESSDTIASLEILGYLGSHFYNSAHVIAARSTAFGLRGKSWRADVLPVRSISVFTPWCGLFVVVSAYQSVGFKATA